MSLIYGAWRPQPSRETASDCHRLAASFEGWPCDYRALDSLGPVCLGGHMLRVYPENRTESQPARDRHATLLLVADCRLDNRVELCAQLSIDPQQARSLPDSHLILAAYQRWGDDCFAKLDGDFAIALWDQTKSRLLLARDLGGVRPLAYATWNGGAAFSSSFTDLYHLPHVPDALDEIAVAAALANLATEPERTPFAAVRWVPAGTFVTIGDNVCATTRFASFAPVTLSKEEIRNPERRLAELLLSSVEKRLRGQGDVVCELSGGFDSGAITALTAKSLATAPRQLRAISWAPDPEIHPLFDGPDERKQIRWMENRYGFRCSYHSFWGDSDTHASQLTRTCFRQNARQTIDGAQTILSGWGGDECVTFYLRSFHPQALFWDGPRAALGRLRLNPATLRDAARTPLQILRGSRAAKLARRSRKRFDLDPQTLIDARLKPEWRSALADSLGQAALQDAFPRDTRQSMLRLATRGHIEFRAAKEQLDAASVGATVSYPMRDTQLVRFMLSLDPHHFDFGSHRRRLFRAALQILSADLAPHTRKQEEALAQYGHPPPSFTCTDAVASALQELAPRYFASASLETPPIRITHRLRSLTGALAHFLNKTS